MRRTRADDGVDTIAADQARDEREFEPSEDGDGAPEALLATQRPYDTLTEAERDDEIDRVYAEADPEMSRRETHFDRELEGWTVQA